MRPLRARFYTGSSFAASPGWAQLSEKRGIDPLRKPAKNAVISSCTSAASMPRVTWT